MTRTGKTTKNIYLAIFLDNTVMLVLVLIVDVYSFINVKRAVLVFHCVWFVI